MPVNLAALAILAETRKSDTKPTEGELRELAERCRRVDLATLGHLLFESTRPEVTDVVLAELRKRGVG